MKIDFLNIRNCGKKQKKKKTQNDWWESSKEKYGEKIVSIFSPFLLLVVHFNTLLASS